MSKRSWAAFALIVLILLIGTAIAEICKGSKAPKADLAQYDVQAILSPADQEAAL